jgi:hypothetical protein
MWTMDIIQQDVQGWKGCRIGCIAKNLKGHLDFNHFTTKL